MIAAQKQCTTREGVAARDKQAPGDVSGYCWCGAAMLPVDHQNSCGTDESADTQHQ